MDHSNVERRIMIPRNVKFNNREFDRIAMINERECFPHDI